MAKSVSTFLMFDGVGEEAAKLYVSLFEGSAIRAVERWAEGEPGPVGQVKTVRFQLAGHELVAFNSPGKHAFTFTPSMSCWLSFVGTSFF